MGVLPAPVVRFETMESPGWVRIVPIVVASFIGIVLLSGVATPVRFSSEHIVATVDGDSIEIDGLYEYRNAAPWPTALRLGIPFPVDSDHPLPIALAVDEVNESGHWLRCLTPVVHDGDVSVRFFFAPYQVRRLRLRYTQPARVPRGRYLLTTTRAWGRPIETAVFELRLADGLECVASSYPLHRLPGERRAFGFRRSEFLPKYDWVFGWVGLAGAA